MQHPTEFDLLSTWLGMNTFCFFCFFFLVCFFSLDRGSADLYYDWKPAEASRPVILFFDGSASIHWQVGWVPVLITWVEKLKSGIKYNLRKR